MGCYYKYIGGYIRIMGAINIKHTESGADVILSSDGTALLLDGTAIGGGQPFTTPEVETTSWSVTNADKGKVFIVDTDNLTLTLPDSSSLDDDWFIRLYTKGNSFQPAYGVVGDLTINPQYSTIGGRVNNNTEWIMRSRQGGILFKDPEQPSNYIFDVHSTTWDIDVHSTANANRANATGWGSIAISGQATASATGSIAIGYLATASGTDSVAIGGNSAQATATDAIAIGTSLANAANGIAIGINNSTTSYGATATDGIAIGQLAKAPTADGIAIGKNANANNGAIAIGYNSYTTSVRGVAVGYDTNAGYQAAAFGYGNSATGNFSLTVGHSNTASHINSAAIGYGVQTTAAYQVALGGSTQTVRISETYTLPATDGTIGQVLTTDGAGAVTFADAGGGTALELYAENYDGTATKPVATGTNAVAIGTGASAGGSGGFASGNGATASGTNSVALGRANTASGQNSFAFGFANTASATYAVAIHGNATADATVAIGRSSSGLPAQAVTGQGAMALGGSYASGTDSFAAAIADNTSSYGATGANSVAIGRLTRTSAQYSHSIGYNNNVSGYSGFACGEGNTVSGARGVALGVSNTSGSTVSSRPNVAIGAACSATGGVAFAFGERADTRGIYGKYAFSSGYGAGTGTAQTGTLVLNTDTTDATPSVLCSGATTDTPSATNQIILPNNSAYGFTGIIVARENSASTNDFAVWEIKGGAVRGATAATTELGTYNINKISESAGAANWSIALSADTTNGAVAITVTGEAAHNIRWVATINTAEVTY
jgi:trimeric autotransporter adhesin